MTKPHGHIAVTSKTGQWQKACSRCDVCSSPTRERTTWMPLVRRRPRARYWASWASVARWLREGARARCQGEEGVPKTAISGDARFVLLNCPIDQHFFNAHLKEW